MEPWYLIVILGFLLILVFIAGYMAWMFYRKSGRSASDDVKTHRIVQKLYSQDTKKRAFIIEYSDNRYRVLCSRYSDKIINNFTGEVAGWQSQEDKPVVSSLYDAVQVAEKWLHEAI